MSLDKVSPGDNVPVEFNAIIEIPMHADPIKYEVDKDTGVITVDRFISTAMRYPCNYGYIPKTLAADGDPLDVLVITPFPLFPTAVIRCRPLGMLAMVDESGIDTKLLAVPLDKIFPGYQHWQDLEDIKNELLLKQIQHFFEHYKGLEPGKWATVNGWQGQEAAKKAIIAGIENYKNGQETA